VPPGWKVELLPYENSVYDTVTTITEYFHMNWGWGGSYNGYFVNDDVSVLSYDFYENRKEIFVDYEF